MSISNKKVLLALFIGWSLLRIAPLMVNELACYNDIIQQFIRSSLLFVGSEAATATVFKLMFMVYGYKLRITVLSDF